MDDNPYIGREFAGFAVRHMLGRGGMGVVMKAVRPSDGKAAAVKLIKEAEARDPKFIARFEREADLLQALNHPHILGVFGRGRSEDGTYFIVMEFVDGSSAGDILKKCGKVPPKQAVAISWMVAKALESALAHNVIHRDIKPDNVLLTLDGKVKLADFGLAKDTSDNQRLTLTGQVIGTPAFMSPEQGRGDKVDHRSDIYSLGATLFCMLTGERPFSGSTPLDIVLKHIKEPPPKLKEKIQGLPEMLYALVEEMMAKSPEDRPQEYGEVIEALEQVALREGWVLEPTTSSDPELTLNDAEGIAGIVREAAQAMETVLPARQEAARIDSDEIPGDARDPRVGKTIGGKYLVRSKLGEGGMGTVYLVRHTDLGHDFALKVLHPSLVANEAFRDRFLREAMAATAFTHKHAVQLRDFGQEGSTLYMTMDFCKGRTLKEILDKVGPMAEARAARIGDQVLLALKEAHAAGLIHRDLKPENIMVEDRHEGDFVRILDFGVAKMMGSGQDGSSASGPGLTRTGTVVGTIQYMSPEQAAGDVTIDARSDLYSLAAILYEAIGGKRHIEASNIQQMLFRLATADPPPLSMHAKVSKGLEKLVMKNLSRDREQRSPKAENFLADLEALSGLSSSVALRKRAIRWLAPAAFAGLVAAAVVFLMVNPFWKSEQDLSSTAGGDKGEKTTPTTGRDSDAEHRKLKSLADGAYKSGNWIKARELFEKAKAFKDTKEVADRLGECRWRAATDALKAAMAGKDIMAAFDQARIARENAPSPQDRLEAERIESELKASIEGFDRKLAEARKFDKAGEAIKALPIYEKLLEEFPKSPSSADCRNRADEIKQLLKDFKGLILRTEPPGAEVLLDNRPIGTTPLAFAEVSPGEHTLLVELQDFNPVERKIDFKKGEAFVLDVNLERASLGDLRIRSSGAQVQIALQGIPRGMTPIDLSRLPAGEVTLEVIGPGGVAYLVQVVVETGKTNSVRIDFEEMVAREEAAFKALAGGKTMADTESSYGEFLKAFPHGRRAAEVKAAQDSFASEKLAWEACAKTLDTAGRLRASEAYLIAYEGKAYPHGWFVADAGRIRDAARVELDDQAYERIRKEPEFYGARKAAQEYLDGIPWSRRASEVKAWMDSFANEEKAYNDFSRTSLYSEKTSKGLAYQKQYPKGLKTQEVAAETKTLLEAETRAFNAFSNSRKTRDVLDLGRKYASLYAGSPRAVEVEKKTSDAQNELRLFEAAERDLAACKEYLQRFPSGEFKGDVEARVSRFGWESSQGVSQFNGILPEGFRRGGKPGEYVWEWDGAVMVYVPEGFFPFGTNDFFGEDEDKPEVMSYLSPFFIDKFEVTNAQFGKFLEWWKKSPDRAAVCHPDTPKGFDPTPKFWNDARFNKVDCPVVGVEWLAARAYARWAGKMLPTEAQWEKAASVRSDDKSKARFSWGNDEPIADWCNFDCLKTCPVPVSQMPRGQSPCGAHHMTGNVAEWCLDVFHDDYLEDLAETVKKLPRKIALNPFHDGPGTGMHSVRGGNWEDPGEELVVTRRRGREGASELVGFRCAIWHVGGEGK